MRKIDLNEEISNIVDFIQNELKKAGFSKVIIGLSGGLDSSVVAALCVRAISMENVLGVMMPYWRSHPNSLKHAKELSKILGIKYEIIDISPMVDVYFDKFESEVNYIRRGNRMARERMCILYDLSAKYRALVVGTGNKSEIMVGYCTQYGDNACAFEPIGHIYKTEVANIAKLLKLPESVINKKPTADLWADQTDEKEMDITYKRLDEILYNLLDLELEKEEITKKGFSQGEIEKVQRMIKKSGFKRTTPPKPAISTIEENR
ncbi:MAG: NAD+ synthase [Candidatus Cloacimonetes bacterium]|nr:NAD+ synthase [Candidatus Cloacimonadota bacterium]